MQTTTMLDEGRTRAIDGTQAPSSNIELIDLYDSLINGGRVQWTTYHHLERQLGSGGQGVVFLSKRRGADGFNQPVAMKFFSPERFPTPMAYDKAMGAIGPSGFARGFDSARQRAGRTRLRRSQSHSHHGHGMD